MDAPSTGPRHAPSLTGRIAAGLLCGGFVALLAWMMLSENLPSARALWLQNVCASAAFFAVFMLTIVLGIFPIRGAVRALVIGTLSGAVSAAAVAGTWAFLELLVTDEQVALAAFRRVLSPAIPGGAIVGALLGYLVGAIQERKALRARKALPAWKRSEARPHHRPRLRALLLFVLFLFGVMFVAQRPLLRLVAVAQLRAAGGKIEWFRGSKSFATWFDVAFPDARVSGFTLSFKVGATDQQIGLVKHLPNLTSLSAPGGKVTDATLAHLQNATALDVLVLARTSVTDEGLAQLRSLPGLAYLNLDKTSVAGPGLAHLQGMTRLGNLSLRGTALTDEGLSNLPALPTLVFLDLGETEVSDAGLKHLGQLSGLRWLDLSGTEVRGDGLSHLSGLALNSLFLRATPLDDEGLAKLAQGPVASRLDLSDTRITDAGLAHLTKVAGLSYLRLANTQVTDVGVAHLRKIAALAVLDLAGTRVTDAGLAELSQHPGIADLVLNDTVITDAGLAHLIGNAGLRTLNLRNTAITDAGLDHLVKLARQRGLPFTPNSLAVTLGDNQVSLAGMQRLRDAGVTVQLALPNQP